MNDKVSITLGNHKLGKKIANTSLTPILSCPSNIPCVKECYALKSYLQYPNVKKAWDRNLRLYLRESYSYFTQIDKFLQNKSVLFFRYLVGGDIPDTRYLLGMVELAVKNPDTNFLSFTKNYSILAAIKRKELPKNLNIIASAWPGYPIPNYIKKNGYRIAWMQDGTEKRIPKGSFLCKGSCENCLNCWNSKKKIDIIMPKH